MKILKMCVNRKYGYANYYCLVDEMPEITYEKIGTDYVGSAVDQNGNVIFSNFLKKGGKGAFAGRELSLKMKDGSIQKIKDFWWDYGRYKKHGEFIDIGIGTLEKLQKCYVYCSCNINKSAFRKMLDDYYSREREYEYYEIEAWANMQYTWFPVIIGGKVFEPLMVNEKGHFAERTTKKVVYATENTGRFFEKVEKRFEIRSFKYKYNDGNRLIRVERKLSDIYRESLPITDEELEEIMKGLR